MNARPAIQSLSRSLFLALACLAPVVAARAQSGIFTYQGRLNQNGAPAAGIFDLQFTLFDVPSGGPALAGSVTHSAVGVTNGLFTVSLNFGSTVFEGANLWLDIAVRPAGSGAFTLLTPRQPVTPTPYAITASRALAVPGISGHSLHAADGNPRDAVVVDEDGNVGIGEAFPDARLHVTSEQGHNTPPRLESANTDRFNAGWDFYHGSVGKGYVGVPDAGAFLAAGELLLYGAPGTPVALWPGGVRTLTADLNGNVGIGTATPTAKLEVRGDMKLGRNGEFQATVGEERLRIVRGSFNADGTIVVGRGFSVERDGGRYTITFDTPFADAPSVTATSDQVTYALSLMVQISDVNASSCKILSNSDSDGPFVNRPLHFIAIGPR